MNYTKDQVRIFQICATQNQLFGLDGQGRIWGKYIGESETQGQWFVIDGPEPKANNEESART